MKSLRPFIQVTFLVHAALLTGCVAAIDEDLAEATAEAEGALIGAEVLDQEMTAFNGGGLPTGNSQPVAQIFTPNHTGYLTKFAYAGSPCYEAWSMPCWYTLQLRAVDGSGNPGQVLWEGRAREPAAPDPGWAFGWATTSLSAPPLVQAGTQYALVLRPDWWMQVLFGDGNPGRSLVWQNSYNYWAGVGDGDDLLFKVWVSPVTGVTTCAELRAAIPSAGDGEYTLALAEGPAKIYCHDMAGTPREYLTLPNAGPSTNFAQYTAGVYVSGTDVRTNYTKIRIDPVTLLVDISDQTFSTSTGELVHGSTTVTSMPYAVAMSCTGAANGVANIDLTGTPFSVLAPNEFVHTGWAHLGSATYSAGNQVVNLTGGGACGWMGPRPPTYDPVNNVGGFLLNLVYDP